MSWRAEARSIVGQARRVWASGAPRSEGLPGPPPPGPTGEAPTVADVERFLFVEARLLDERRWDEWLGLWSDDARYGMPTRSSPSVGVGGERPVTAELTAEGGAWWIDDDKERLQMRVAKLKTGKAWAEEPPSRTRRFVTNVEVRPAAGTGLEVRSNLLLYRTRRESDLEIFAAARTDLLHPTAPGDFLISRRRVVLDASVAVAANLVLFF